MLEATLGQSSRVALTATTSSVSVGASVAAPAMPISHAASPNLTVRIACSKACAQKRAPQILVSSAVSVGRGMKRELLPSNVSTIRTTFHSVDTQNTQTCLT